MKSKLLLPFLLVTLNACSNTNPIIGTWNPEDSPEEWLISQKSDEFNLTITHSGLNLGIFPVEVTDKAFRATLNLGFGVGQYNCSITTSKDELDCNLITTTFWGRETSSFKMVRQKIKG
jgi:hypothetical protein